MAKKKSWFNLVKRFFLFETLINAQKDNRRKWMFGRFRTKRLASIKAPSPPRDNIKYETEEDQKKHALTVAIAAVAAAEAAVAAAQVAAEVVRLTGSDAPKAKEEQTNDVKPGCSSSSELDNKFQQLAAIKIQASFRGYLARKALRALKGIVRLQAIIRGRVVRRQALTALKCLQSIVNIQSQVCARRFQMVEGTWQQHDEKKELITLKDKILKVDTNSQTRWDNCNGGLKYWLDQWVDTKSKDVEVEDIDSVWTSNRKPTRLKTFSRQYHCDAEGVDSPVRVQRRRSFHGKQGSLGEDSSFITSPVVPTYMAATQSTKAKVRSMSSPKLRPGTCDTQSESYSPYKNKLCLISSVTSKPDAYEQRSPTLKGIKSKQTLKDLSFDSECSLPNWVQKSTFK
ncbi:hypothetical protein Goarm_004216 [Gossypium armourianum]|uniref:DUF4005 domain-containing protein n=1 Tax=Gossypium armourianum TaxID=34283 RepID=A0A7J9K5N9_9ROSI|nr:hypothetical protein [Gossypium armourianum]